MGISENLIQKRTGGGAIDVISGGFPCQPFSKAGRQHGKDDDRYLWPEMLRVIKEIKPSFVVGENVTGIIDLALEEVCASLEAEGYEVKPFNIPAASVSADHIRERIWILAYTDSKSRALGVFNRNSKECSKRNKSKKIGCENRIITKMGTEINCGIYQGRKFSEPKMVRISNGVSTELDEIRGYGNAIVPQVAFEIFKAIEQFIDTQK